MTQELWIQGYKNKPNKNFFKKCGFDLSEIKNDKYLVVFAGYSEYDIPIGTVLEWFSCKDNKCICVTVKIQSINLGFGGPQTSIPKGYKSILLLTGRANHIDELKSELTPVSDWHEKNSVPIKAINIGKNNTDFLGVGFDYTPGDPFW